MHFYVNAYFYLFNLEGDVKCLFGLFELMAEHNKNIFRGSVANNIRKYIYI